MGLDGLLGALAEAMSDLERGEPLKFSFPASLLFEYLTEESGHLLIKSSRVADQVDPIPTPLIGDVVLLIAEDT